MRHIRFYTFKSDRWVLVIQNSIARAPDVSEVIVILLWLTLIILFLYTFWTEWTLLEEQLDFLWLLK